MSFVDDCRAVLPGKESTGTSLIFRKKKNMQSLSCMCDLNYGSLVHTALLYIPLAPLFAFPCLGLELNFKSRYFSPAVFLVFLFFFPPSETMRHCMNPQGLYLFSLNVVPTRPQTPTNPLLWLCKYSIPPHCGLTTTPDLKTSS